MPVLARDFPPREQAKAHQRALREILTRTLPERQDRNNPRVVKRKMSSYPVKRPHHQGSTVVQQVIVLPPELYWVS